MTEHRVGIVARLLARRRADAPPTAVPSETAPAAQPAAVELLCYRCDYPLTGLPQPRCPECGLSFDWGDPRLRPGRREKIAFERARGVGRLGGFIATWITVLLAPWIFGRQAAARAGLGAAAAFGLTCVALACGILLVDPDPLMYGAWMLTALVHVTVQAWALAHLDVRLHGRAGGELRSWLAVGLYTWAFFFVHLPTGGPPVILFTDVLHAATGTPLPMGTYKFDVPYGRTVEALAAWGQLAWWLLVMGLIWAGASWAHRRSVSHVLIGTPLAILLAFLVYTMVLETIGVHVVMWLAT